MSGHSKWATIHRAKEAKDAKKGAAFTKLAMAITVAVRQGGGIGDPEQNFRLRLAMDKARQLNMPKENIARAIAKGTGEAGGAALEEAVFEGFLPGGAAIVMEAVTDNKARTAQQVRGILDKGGGSMGSSGAVGYMFNQLGQIVVNLNGKDAQEAELAMIDLGVEDTESDEERLMVFCEKDKLYELKTEIEKLGYTVDSAELVMKPNTWIDVNEEIRVRNDALAEQLEDLDDVTHVWTNYA